MERSLPGWGYHLFCVALLFWSPHIFAMNTDWLRYSGNIGARLETNLSEFENLPDTYASTYFNFRVSAGLIGAKVQGEFSTAERRFSPEFIKKLGISPSIGFLHLDIGDHYPKYSKLVMSGAKVRGLSMLLDPGKFVFGLTGGRVRVGGADKLGEYRREVYGMQIGVNLKRFEFITQFSRLNDLTSEIDSIYTPQESLTGGVSTKLLLPGQIQIQGEAGFGLHTRDKRSAAFDTLLSFRRIKPENLGITPRLSTRMDYAYKYNILIPLQPVRFIYQRDYIGPGFQTLGTPYLKNDVMKDLFRANINLLQGKLFATLMYLTQENNLNSEQLSKTEMDNFSVSTRIRPVRFLSVRGRYATLSRRVSNPRDAMRYTKDAFSMTPEFRVKTGMIANRISMTYGVSISRYRERKFDTKNLRIGYAGNMENGFTFTAEMNRSDYGHQLREGYTIGVGKSFPQKNASISANLGLGHKTVSTISGHLLLPWDFRLNTEISFFRLTGYRLRYQISIVRNF